MKDRQVNRIDRNTIMVNHLTEDVKEKPDPVKGPRHRAVRQLPAWRLSLAGLNRTRRRNPEAPVTQRRSVENGQSPSLARWRRAPPPTSSTRCRISLSSRVCTMPCRPRSARRSAPGQVGQRGDTWPSGPPAVGRPVTNAIAPGAAELARALRLAITSGILLAYLVNFAFKGVTDNWRWMLGVAVIPGAALAVGMLTVPHTPRWLMDKGREDEARTVLERLRRGTPTRTSTRRSKTSRRPTTASGPRPFVTWPKNGCDRCSGSAWGWPSSNSSSASTPSSTTPPPSCPTPD